MDTQERDQNRCLKEDRARRERERYLDAEAILDENFTQYRIEYEPVRKEMQREISWQPESNANFALVAPCEKRKRSLRSDSSTVSAEDPRPVEAVLHSHACSKSSTLDDATAVVENGEHEQAFVKGASSCTGDLERALLSTHSLIRHSRSANAFKAGMVSARPMTAKLKN